MFMHFLWQAQLNTKTFANISAELFKEFPTETSEIPEGKDQAVKQLQINKVTWAQKVIM